MTIVTIISTIVATSTIIVVSLFGITLSSDYKIMSNMGSTTAKEQTQKVFLTEHYFVEVQKKEIHVCDLLNIQHVESGYSYNEIDGNFFLPIFVTETKKNRFTVLNKIATGVNKFIRAHRPRDLINCYVVSENQAHEVGYIFKLLCYVHSRRYLNEILSEIIANKNQEIEIIQSAFKIDRGKVNGRFPFNNSDFVSDVLSNKITTMTLQRALPVLDTTTPPIGTQNVDLPTQRISTEPVNTQPHLEQTPTQQQSNYDFDKLRLAWVMHRIDHVDFDQMVEVFSKHENLQSLFYERLDSMSKMRVEQIGEIVEKIHRTYEDLVSQDQK